MRRYLRVRINSPTNHIRLKLFGGFDVRSGVGNNALATTAVGAASLERCSRCSRSEGGWGTLLRLGPTLTERPRTLPLNHTLGEKKDSKNIAGVYFRLHSLQLQEQQHKQHTRRAAQAGGSKQCCELAPFCSCQKESPFGLLACWARLYTYTHQEAEGKYQTSDIRSKHYWWSYQVLLLR